MGKFSITVLLVILLQIYHVPGEKANAQNMARLLKKMKENGVLGDVDDNTYAIMMSNIKNGGDVFAIKDEELKAIRKTYLAGLDTLKKNQDDTLNQWKDLTDSLKMCQDSVSKIEEERMSWAKTNAKYVKTVTDAHKMITQETRRAEICESNTKKLRDDVKNKDESILKLKEEIESLKTKQVKESDTSSDQAEKKQLAELKQKFQTVKNQLENKNKKLLAEVKSLRDWNEKLQTTLLNFQDKEETNGTSASESEIQKLKKKFDIKNKEAADCKYKSIQLESDLKIIIKSNKEMQDDYRHQMKKIKNAMEYRELEHLRTSTNELLVENEQLKVKNEDIVYRFKDCKQEIREADKEIKELKKRGDGSNDKVIVDCKLQIKNLQNENEKLQSEIKGLTDKTNQKHKEYLKTLNDIRTKLNNDKLECLEKLENVEETLKDTKLNLQETQSKAKNKEESYMKDLDDYVIKLLKKTKEADEYRTGKIVAEKLFLKKKRRMEINTEEITNERDALEKELAGLKKKCKNTEKSKENVQLDKDHKKLKTDYEKIYQAHQKEKDKNEKLQLQHTSLLDKCGQKSSETTNVQLLSACIERERELRNKYQNLKGSYEQKLLRNTDKLEYYTNELEICNKELQIKSVEEDKAINAKIVAENLLVKRENQFKQQILLETSKTKQDSIDSNICTQKLTDLKYESNVKINNCNKELTSVKNHKSRVEESNTKLEHDITICESNLKKYLDKDFKQKDKVSKHVQQTAVEIKAMETELKTNKKSLKECEQKYKTTEKTLKMTGKKLESCQNSVKLISTKHDKLLARCKQDTAKDTNTNCQKDLDTMKRTMKNVEEAKKTLEKDISICEVDLKKLSTKDLKEKQKVTKHIQETIEELNAMAKELKDKKKLAKESEDKYQNSQETLKLIREKMETCQKSLASLTTKHSELETSCKKARKELKGCGRERDTLNAAKDGFESYLLSKDEEFRETVTKLHKRTKAAIADEVYFRKSFLIAAGMCVLMLMYIFCSCIKSRRQNVADKVDDSKNTKQGKKESKKKK